MLTGTLTRRTATLVLTMEQKLARCATPLTKMQLFSALIGGNRKINGQWVTGSTININNIDCILSGIMREDGSGSSFILTLYGPDSNIYRCYVRTID